MLLLSLFMGHPNMRCRRTARPYGRNPFIIPNSSFLILCCCVYTNRTSWSGTAAGAGGKFSADLSVAKVYVSLFHTKTNPSILIKRLNAHQTELRTMLARNVQLRKMPELRFYLDDTLDTAARIEKLLDDVREEDERRRSERGEYTENNPNDNDRSEPDNDDA